MSNDEVIKIVTDKFWEELRKYNFPTKDSQLLSAMIRHDILPKLKHIKDEGYHLELFTNKKRIRIIITERNVITTKDIDVFSFQDKEIYDEVILIEQVIREKRLKQLLEKG